MCCAQTHAFPYFLRITHLGENRPFVGWMMLSLWLSVVYYLFMLVFYLCCLIDLCYAVIVRLADRSTYRTTACFIENASLRRAFSTYRKRQAHGVTIAKIHFTAARAALCPIIFGFQNREIEFLNDLSAFPERMRSDLYICLFRGKRMDPFSSL